MPVGLVPILPPANKVVSKVIAFAAVINPTYYITIYIEFYDCVFCIVNACIYWVLYNVFKALDIFQAGTLYGTFVVLSICNGTLLTSIENVPVNGAECVLVLVTVKLTGTVPATSDVLLEYGNAVVGRYLLRIIAY